MAKKSKKNMAAEAAAEVAAPAAPEAAPQEVAPVEEQPRKRAEAPKVHFDGWWAARASQIPAVHKKEIIRADMKGRKIPMVATMAEFDEALKKYGVVLG